MEVLNEIESLLADKFGGYQSKKETAVEVYYYKRYDRKILLVVIKVTLKPEKKPKIETVIKRIKVKKPCLELKNTSSFSFGWQKVLEEKIRNLEQLVEAAPGCCKCETPTVPLEKKNSKTGTKFVAYYCPRCGERINTRFGVGIKSNLHRLLK